MIGLWLFFRALRWLAWISFFGMAIYIKTHVPAVLTSFGHLQLQFEVGLIATGNACIFLGFMELMMRERAGIPRPELGQLIPPVASQPRH